MQNETAHFFSVLLHGRCDSPAMKMGPWMRVFCIPGTLLVSIKICSLNVIFYPLYEGFHNSVEFFGPLAGKVMSAS